MNMIIDYQEIFMGIYKFYVAFLIIDIIGIIYLISLWFNQSYWDQFDYLKDDKLMKAIFQYLPVLLLICCILIVITPVIQDKSLIDTNGYCVKNHGVAATNIVSGGPFGRFERITVQFDGTKNRFRVAWAEDGIKKGDIVNVVYLPHSTYAIIEYAK